MKLPEGFQPREYQTAAIESWKSNGYRGVLNMATGTGKTLTALLGMYELMNEKESLVNVIVCPYIHLVEQWAEDVISMGILPILAYSKYPDWKRKLYQQIQLINFGRAKYVTVIITNSSFITDDMASILQKSKSDILLIADEMHNFGSENLMKLLNERFSFRLGLSATPTRFYDKEVSDKLMNYFGGEVYKFDLGEAISEGFLTPYYYYPHIVYLNNEEFSIYRELTIKIVKALGIEEKNQSKSYIESLLIKRAKVIQGAEAKIPKLEELMNEYAKKDSILVYCGSTNVNEDLDTKRQIDYIVRKLGIDLGMYVSRFTADESQQERQNIINRFQSKEIQSIVAIRCLDEGVNIPSIRTVFLVSSSTNPKEHIQRRGRVLRNFPNKEFSEIFDFVVLPPDYSAFEDYEAGAKSIVIKELARVSEFCNLALNKEEVLGLIDSIMDKYNISEGELK
jgi:superfamily II DNA or RNA helicase